MKAMGDLIDTHLSMVETAMEERAPEAWRALPSVCSEDLGICCFFDSGYRALVDYYSYLVVRRVSYPDNIAWNAGCCMSPFFLPLSGFKHA